ncbi:hypothetical protein ACGFY9_06870 [Streptomyces sp. NPDC048504]|uniref:hypothetical protein n=1 Tax=Streptomyces sp. NPDC048504 TaxID=3365559 RepID=UPI003720F43F
MSFFMAILAAEPHGTRVIVTHAGAQARAALDQLSLPRALDIYEGDGPDNA